MPLTWSPHNIPIKHGTIQPGTTSEIDLRRQFPALKGMYHRSLLTSSWQACSLCSWKGCSLCVCASPTFSIAARHTENGTRQRRPHQNDNLKEARRQRSDQTHALTRTHDHFCQHRLEAHGHHIIPSTARLFRGESFNFTKRNALSTLLHRT